MVSPPPLNPLLKEEGNLALASPPGPGRESIRKLPSWFRRGWGVVSPPPLYPLLREEGILFAALGRGGDPFPRGLPSGRTHHNPVCAVPGVCRSPPRGCRRNRYLMPGNVRIFKSSAASPAVLHVESASAMQNKPDCRMAAAPVSLRFPAGRFRVQRVCDHPSCVDRQV